MRRPRKPLSLATLIIAALGVAFGCSKPTVSTVYVDVPSLVAASAGESPKDVKIAPPPKSEKGIFASIPGKAASRVPDRPKASGEALRRLIEEAQDLAIRRIENSLRKFYNSELQRFELAQEREMTEAERAAYAAASERLRNIFEIYANDRMPVFTRLTLLAGFPDPNPASVEPDNPLPRPLQKRFEESVDLRTRLRTIDAGFDDRVLALLNSVQDLTAEQRAAMRLRIEEFKRDLDRRAEEEAKNQVRLTASELGLELIEPIAITLPATSAQSVQIPAQPGLPPAPNVPAKGILSSKEDRERLIRHELGIWAKLNRYEISSARSGHVDKTPEFQSWRSQFAVGR
jgi:hypothetical protein